MDTFINFPIFIAQIINFFILAFILKKFLFWPLVDKIETRQEKMDEAKKEMKEIEGLYDKLWKDKEELLQQAKKQADSIVEESKKIAQNKSQEIIDFGKKEALALKQVVQQDFDKEKREVYTNFRSNVLKIALKINQKVLNRKDDKLNEELTSNLDLLLKKTGL